MKTRLLGIAVVLLLLAGCAKPTPTYLYRTSGGTDQDGACDHYECVQQSRTSWSGGGPGQFGFYAMAIAANQAEAQANQLYAMCMQARGWGRTPDQEMAKRLHGSQVPPPPLIPTTVAAPTGPRPAPDWCKADNLEWQGDRCVEKKK